MIGTVITGAVGILCLVIGILIWKKGKISLLHDYHYGNVSEENKKAFCALTGRGLCLMGLGMLITAVVLAITESVWSFLFFAAGFAAGLVLLIAADRKYNR